MSVRPVNIRIERLTLAGPRFNRRETSAFRTAFEGELKRLLRERPLNPSGDAAYRRLEAPVMPAATHAARLGEQAARTLFDTLAAAAAGHAR